MLVANAIVQRGRRELVTGSSAAPLELFIVDTHFPSRDLKVTCVCTRTNMHTHTHTHTRSGKYHCTYTHTVA